MVLHKPRGPMQGPHSNAAAKRKKVLDYGDLAHRNRDVNVLFEKIWWDAWDIFGMFSTIWLAHDPWLMLLDRLCIDVFLDWLDFLPYAIWLQKNNSQNFRLIWKCCTPSFHWMKTSGFSLKKYQFSYMFLVMFYNF